MKITNSKKKTFSLSWIWVNYSGLLENNFSDGISVYGYYLLLLISKFYNSSSLNLDLGPKSSK